MNVSKIEENLQALIANLDEASFIYDLLLAYGLSKSAITRLKTGSYNVANAQDEVLWKKKVFFKTVMGKDLHAAIDGYRRDTSVTRHSPRFILVTDFKTFLAVDTKTDDTLDIPIQELSRYYDFFLPWAGREKAPIQIENPADRRAAERMAVLYDEIFKDNPFNPEKEPKKAHALNVFLCRLLFCFFAEDTEIFKEQACFTNSLKNQTQDDGSEVRQHLERLFDVLSLKEDDPKRKKYPAFLQVFPWVNGGLFEKHLEAPQFSKKSRKLLLESGDLDWSAINPDIFGSMMQAVVHRGQRASLGMHYTSVPNIMKVIEPLFLNELREELEKAEGDIKKLEKLHKRIQNIKVFDPACGSGNFLIIAYKELRRLEMDIFQTMQDASGQQKIAVPLTSIKLTNFYGIEIDDFAHEIAILSLWLAEHQMNVEFKEAFGVINPSLPLKPGGNIVCKDATRTNWESICSKDESEIYLLGNPPYLGAGLQNEKQKSDMALVFEGIEGYKNLDYIACWFFKGAKYIRDTKIQLAFVTTNSISQGVQVSLLWPHIFSQGLEIGFAYQSFKWTNNAKGNAGVTCSIIGIRHKSNNYKYIFKDNIQSLANNINPYLVASKTNTILRKRSTPISNLPKMDRGNGPVDGGNLLLSSEEKKELLSKYPESGEFLRKIMGATEFTNGIERWCLWIEDSQLDKALKIPLIAERLKQVTKMRRNSPKLPTQKLASSPHRFGEIRHKDLNSIIAPRHGSDRREYMPFGFLSPDVIVSDAAQVIYTNEVYVFGVISSKIHLCWIKASCGKIKEDPRYSSLLGYNNFPIPNLSEKQKTNITTHVFDVLSEREKHPEKTIAQLYDPDEMPNGLREAHRQLDVAVEQCYRIKPFTSDEERLEHLFKLYEEMTQNEQKELQHA